jgi:hypothetical protein
MELEKPLNAVNRFIYDEDTNIIGDNMPTTPAQGIDKSGFQTGLLAHTIGKIYKIWFYDLSQGNWIDYGQSTTDQRSLTLPWLTNYDKVFFEAINPVVAQELRIVGLTGSIVVDGDPSDGIDNENTLFQNGNADPAGTSIISTPGPSGPQGPSGPSISSTFLEDDNGNLIPTADVQYNLGNVNFRIQDIFTQNLSTGDINLNNEGRQNEVDGTSGHWSIQEGANDLFLINRNTGEKFKFNLSKID